MVDYVNLVVVILGNAFTRALKEGS